MVKFSGRIAEELEGNAKSIRKMSLDDDMVKIEDMDETHIKFRGLDRRDDEDPDEDDCEVEELNYELRDTAIEGRLIEEG